MVGANPVRIDYGEAYLALQQGIADAMENPIEGLYAVSFNEVTDCLIDTDHLLNPSAVVLNERTFQNLGEELQEVLIEAALDGSAYYVEIRDDEEARALAAMEAQGIEVVKPDLAPFAEKARARARELEAQREWSEGLFDFAFGLANGNWRPPLLPRRRLGAGVRSRSPTMRDVVLGVLDTLIRPRVATGRGLERVEIVVISATGDLEAPDALIREAFTYVYEQ